MANTTQLRWTPEALDEVLKQTSQGKTLNSIAKERGASASGLYAAIKNYKQKEKSFRKTSAPRKPKFIDLHGDELPKQSGKLVLVVGSIEDVRKLMGGWL